MGEAVGEGDAAEGQDEGGPGADRVGEPLGAAEGEDHGAAAAVLGFLAEAARQLFRGAVLPALVEQDQLVLLGQGLEQGGLVLDLAQGDDGVALEAFQVLRLGRLEVGFLQAADGEDEDFQPTSVRQ